jgi:WD40 repeat protein
VRAVAFGAGGARLTSADLRGAVRTWDVASGQLAREWPQAGTFTAIAASPEGESLVTVDDGGVAVVWDSAAAAARLRLAVTGEKGHEGRLSAVALGPHGRRLATAGEDLAIRVWDAGSGRELIEPAQPAYRARVTALAFSPDGRLLAAADADRILVWDAVTGDLTDRVPARWRAVEAVALSSDGRLLASAGGDGLAHVDPLDLGGLTDLARRRLAIAEERP